jgi:hypothetical protein
MINNFLFLTKGDFAIMLGAGMPFKFALVCNLITSCFIYMGAVLGIVLGESLNANVWIYSVAAGMFIYISVCDMLPELGEMGLEIEQEEIEARFGGQHRRRVSISEIDKFGLGIKVRNIIMQNSGVILGIVTMFLLAYLSKKLEF